MYPEKTLYHIKEFLKPNGEQTYQQRLKRTSFFNLKKKAKLFVLLEDKLYYKDHNVLTNTDINKEVIFTGDKLPIMRKSYSDPAMHSTGVQSFYDLLNNKYVNFTLRDCEDFLNSMRSSQIHAKPLTQFTYQPIISTKAKQRFIIDTITVSQNTHMNDNYKYALTCIDHFSKFAQVRQLKTLGAQEILNAFKDIVTIMNIPEIIQSDNGKEFVNESFNKYCENNNIKHITSSTYHPQTNGLVERFNQTIKRKIYSFMTTHKTSNWSANINELVNSYNDAIQSTTNQKPRDLHYGHGKIYQTITQNIANHQVSTAKQTVSENVAKYQPKDAYEKIEPGEWIRIVKKISFDAVEKRNGANVIVKKYKQQFSKDKYKVERVIQDESTKLVKLLVNNKWVPFNSVIVVPENDNKPIAREKLGNREAALNRLHNMPVEQQQIELPEANQVQLRPRRNIKAPNKLDL